MELVTSIEQLKKLCDRNGRAEFYVFLAGGLCHSAKEMHYDKQCKKFENYNEIDETWQHGISEKALYKKTMIPEAIEKGAMFYYVVQLWGIE